MEGVLKIYAVVGLQLLSCLLALGDLGSTERNEIDRLVRASPVVSKKQLVNQLAFQVAKKSKENICWVPPTVFKIRYIKYTSNYF